MVSPHQVRTEDDPLPAGVAHPAYPVSTIQFVDHSKTARNTRSRFSAAFLDQALMGGVGFGTSACLVALGSKADFAVYSLVYGLILFSQNVHNAVVITPLMANSSRLERAPGGHFSQAMLGLGSTGAILFGLFVGGLVYAGVSEIPPAGLALSLGSFCALVGLWAREQRRSVQFLKLNSWSVFRGDIFYAAWIAGALALSFALSRHLTTSAVLFAFGIGGILTGKLAWAKPGRKGDTPGHAQSVRLILREQVAWTVPSVIVSWFYSNSYVYIVAGLIGLSALAELNAARLLVVPVSLLQVAWNRLYLPSAGADFASGDRAAAVRGAWMGLWTVIGGTIVYGAALIAAMSLPFFTHFQRLAGISITSVLLWIVYFLVSGARGIATSLHIAQTAFRRLFLIGLAGAGVGVACMLALGHEFGTSGIVIAMITGEAAMAVFLWSRAMHAADLGRAT